MKNIRHGEIYLINFDPSIGHEYKKPRPAIILSSNEVLKRSTLVTCVAISGNTRNFVPEDDIIIKKNHINNLYYDSVVKMHHIVSYDKTRIMKYIGQADDNLMNRIKTQLKKHFTL